MSVFNDVISRCRYTSVYVPVPMAKTLHLAIDLGDGWGLGSEGWDELFCVNTQFRLIKYCRFIYTFFLHEFSHHTNAQCLNYG